MKCFTETTSAYGVAAICRMEKDLVQTIAEGRRCTDIVVGSCLTVLLGSASFGVAFGAWRCLTQACYSAFKMPVLIFSVILGSAVANTMLAQALGARLSFKHVFTCMVVSFAVASALMGALSPVVLFFVFQCPPPESENSMSVYRSLLWINTIVVGLSGIVGNIRLYQLLKRLTSSAAVSCRVLLAWMFVSGLLGCELSWVVSPFLARPDVPVSFFNPNAFRGNFFEYLWRAASGGL